VTNTPEVRSPDVTAGAGTLAGTEPRPDRSRADQPVIVAVGCAPSSGSTLLADLIDSIPDAVCGSEVKLFSVRAHYDDGVTALRGARLPSSPTGSCVAAREQLIAGRLYRYGLNTRRVREMADESDCFPAFAATFLGHLAALRGRAGRLLVEKTPRNAHTARSFLDAFPSGRYVHVVRHPAWVCASQLRRGRPPYLAASTWLIDNAPAWQLRDHPRVLTVKYEELVQAPFELAARLGAGLGTTVTAGELAELYPRNYYRRFYSRKALAWSITRYGELGDANRTPPGAASIAALANIANSRVGDGYARHLEVPMAGLLEVAEHFGYELDRLPGWPSIAARPSRPRREPAALRFLAGKWRTDMLRGDASPWDLPAYLRPVWSRG